MFDLKDRPGSFATLAGRALLKPARILRKLLIVTLACALGFTLSNPSLAHAEDLQISSQGDEQSVNPTPVSTPGVETDTQAGDGLEIGPEIIGQPVGAAVKAPTVNDLLYDATTISGANLAKAKVDKKTVIATVHVSLKDSSGTEKASLSVTPTTGTTWKVDLPGGVKVAKGDTVTVYQQIGEDKSPEVTKTAQPSKASTVTLKMPTGEIWIEQTSSNIVNKDEQTEAIQKLKDANSGIAGDIKSVKFSIDGTDHAYYEVTYTDGSTSGQVEAPDLKIKQVTDYSRGATLGSITIVDNVIKGQLAGEGPFDGIKVQIILSLSDAVKDSYCDKGKCLVDKDTSDPVDATVNSETGEFTYTIPNPDLKLDQKVGVTVKEPHKFKSCSQTTVKPVKVEKIEVRDPRKVTADDKKAIDAAIRKAYTVGGESKLPNGTGDWDGVPAVIQIDDSGNVKIFSGNDVAGDWDWDNGGIFVPEKNEDGSVKIKDGVEPKITIPAKDLLKNIAPESPAIAVDTDKGEVTITPPAYKDPGDDTDLLSYTVTYKDADGAEKTVTAERDLDTNKWSGPGVNEESGVITLSVEKIELAGTIKATAKDNGGLEGDTDKLDSVEESKKLETATVSYDANKGTGEMKGKTVNKGSKYAVLPNAFTAPDDTQEFKAWEVDGKEVAPGTEITVNGDTVVKAVWKKTQVKVTYDANGGSGEMAAATVDKGGKYAVLPNAFTAPDDTQEFKAWEVDGKEVAPGTEITVNGDTVVKAVWKKTQVKVTYDANGGSGEMAAATVDKGGKYAVLPNAFTAPDDTQEFKAWEVDGKEVAPGTEITVNGDTVVKAVWKKIQVKVTYDANGGEGNMEGKTLDKGGTYKVLASTFTAPENQEFKTWEIDGKEVAPDTEITVTKDTVVKAVWKDIMVDINFEPGEGSGTMDKVTVKKGSTFNLPSSKFTAPENMELKGWKIGDTEYQVGDKITVNDNTTVTAIWKKIQVNVTYEGNGGKGSMDGATVDKGSEYTVLPNGFTAPDDTQEFKAWEVDGKEVAPGAKITVKDNTVVKAIWKKIQVNVTYDANGGKGSMDGATVDKGSEYTVLPNGFTAPDDTQEFKAWEVDGKEVAPGAKITVKDNTVVKAIWKKIQVNVTYDANGGKGSMDGATVDKGSEYAVLPNGFTAPDDTQEFKAWEVDGQEVAPGAKITINGDTVVKAIWKKIPVDNPNGGSNKNGDGAAKASKSRKSRKLPKTGNAGMPYQVAAMILAAGGLVIAGRKKIKKH
ncbi:LPXTG cell wall anchor domain-containing protein [Propionimicrobium lymphophilum]|uniref:LPXTG cell wall anchor domain-containing protein n=1 Tax=Propionimicrobium lymphophilum TaxID=33012 RepID=UPI002889986C|nr:LPXTG cell wall anchor domain-containing protein [Propionimicrobium lymphophilum]